MSSRAEPAVAVLKPTRLVALMRPKQWVKNAFVLAGLFFSHLAFQVEPVLRSLSAAAVFCLVSSAMYCFNDIFDRNADRLHPMKRNRPLAEGSVTVRQAAILAGVLLVGATALALLTGFGRDFYLLVGLYVAINTLYSTWLKHLSLVDVALVSSGFLIRLAAGNAVVGVPPSSWVILCTGLLSIVLALGKRRGDLEMETPSGRRSLHGYTVGFIDTALSMTAAATVILYAEFTVSDYSHARYNAPLLYLTTFPVVLGLLRYLQLVIVERRYGSPGELLLSDRPLQLVTVVWVALVAFFIYK